MSQLARSLELLVLAFGVAAPSIASPQVSAAPDAGVMPGKERWLPTSTPGLRGALVLGKPQETGLYVVRFEMVPGCRVRPHKHRDARHTTVLSGEVLVGLGDSFDPSRLRSYPAGAFFSIAAGLPHYLASKDGAVLQDVGIGPTDSVTVGDDPPFGGATPGAAWMAARGAYGSGAFRDYMRLISPSAQNGTICTDLGFLLGFASVEGGPLGAKELDELEAIARRHGAPRLRHGSDGAKAEVFTDAGIGRVADKIGLYADIMAYLRAHRIGPPVPAFLMAELTEVKIDNDRATAKAGTFGTFAFDHLEDGWFLHPASTCEDP